MKRISNKKYLIVLSTVSFLMGCSQSDQMANAHVSSWPVGMSVSKQGSHPVLTFYLDQTGRDPNNGLSRQTYEAAITGCKSAGQQIVPLSVSDIAELGVRRLRIWQEPGRFVRQIDTWTPVRGNANPLKELCDYVGIKKHSIREIETPDGLYTLDLTKGTGSYQKYPSPITPGIGNADLGSVDNEIKAHTIPGATKKIGDDQVLGQPCQVWQNWKPGDSMSSVECIWSGGRKWGIGGLVLWRKSTESPTSMPIGNWVTTTEFDVGRLPAGSNQYLEIPKSIQISGALSKSMVSSP